MAIYRFRVIFEDFDDVQRDIEIRSTQTFEDLHFAIHSSIGFEPSPASSFYMSDDNWKKGKEITSREIQGDVSEGTPAMKKSRLCDFISDPHQKIYYHFDLASQWTFRIELIKILALEDPVASYPRCIRTSGEAPKQFHTTTVGVIPIPEDFDPDAMDELDEPEDSHDSMEETPEVADPSETQSGFYMKEEENEKESDEFETAGEEEDFEEENQEDEEF
ncbi:MAG: hypothetical protein IT242_09200 [Bacteroidia bacterium]|nr:hypothetical protein [Bacteroidia bacterium]